MSKQFENMQKLAFGKSLINESKITPSEFKARIREMILDEAKKKKKSKPEDVAPQEDVDVDITAAPETETSEPSMDTVSNGGEDVVRDIQNLLQDAYKKAQQLPDNEDKEKTINQISNTIKMFINTQVLGGGQQPGI
jgi:predicted ATP-grasp superfamily ATP-dependent carboligase